MSLDEIEITAISHGGVKGTYIERSKTAGVLVFLEGRGLGMRRGIRNVSSSACDCLHAIVLQFKMMSVECREIRAVLKDYKAMLSLNETFNEAFSKLRISVVPMSKSFI